MIKYFVRTTGERTLDSSYSQLEYELLIDSNHQPIESFIQQLEYISEYDAVLIEDDCILCKNFKQRIEDVIANYKDKVINFFTFPLNYFKTRESKTFANNQCTYYPKGLAKMIADNMKLFINESSSYSKIESLALEKMNLLHLQYRPCLVQHNDFQPSLIQKHHIPIPRVTPYFIDYLDELGLDYNNAKNFKEKLRRKMYENFSKCTIK